LEGISCSTRYEKCEEGLLMLCEALTGFANHKRLPPISLAIGFTSDLLGQLEIAAFILQKSEARPMQVAVRTLVARRSKPATRGFPARSPEMMTTFIALNLSRNLDCCANFAAADINEQRHDGS
jgi:hypothetical protein